MTRDPLAVVRRRLHEQRLVGEPFDRPEHPVEWLGAIQAQEFAESKWPLGQRTRDCSDADLEQTFARGEILRTHLLRPTWHFVARHDIRWLLRVTRPRVHALNRYWYRKLSSTPTRWRAATRSSLTRSPTASRRPGASWPRACVLSASRPTGCGAATCSCTPSSRSWSAAAHVEASSTRTPCSTTAPDQATDERPREQAVAELALRYFRSHGPATIRDFTAWSSLTVADARDAIDRIGDELEREDHDATAWYAAPVRTATPTPVVSGALLVPMYDETIVAYQDLRVMLAHPPPRAGLLDRAIVIDSYTVGSWNRTLTAHTTTVHASLFRPLTRDECEALNATVQRFGRFLAPPASLAAALTK